jgi:hypothetical protein
MDNEAKTSELTREHRVELFLMQVRGSLATAFLFANIRPTTDEMCALYDVGELNMRMMGEIAWRTGFNLNLQLHDVRTPTRAEAGAGDGGEG